MPVFAVIYDYAENSDAARDLHRPAHREFLGSLTGAVKTLATGPWADGPAGALIIADAASAAEIEAAFDQDPFYLEHLISNRQIRKWTQVKGPWA